MLPKKRLEFTNFYVMAALYLSLCTFPIAIQLSSRKMEKTRIHYRLFSLQFTYCDGQLEVLLTLNNKNHVIISCLHSVNKLSLIHI